MRSYSDLPEEILFNIVSRLPAKSVGQCRCVSKPWKTLLSQPKFIQAHLHFSRSLPRESLLLQYPFKGNPFFSASLSDAHHLLELDQFTIPATMVTFRVHPYSQPGSCCSCHSCDGLVLLLDGNCREFVLNPITREMRELPPMPYRRPNMFTSLSGFGYDSVNCDYKVVALCEYESASLGVFFCVFSLKRGSWETDNRSCYPYYINRNVSGVFVNGCIHWLVRRTLDDRLAILAYNLSEQKVCQLPFPSNTCTLEMNALPVSRYDVDLLVSRYFVPHLASFAGSLWMLDEGESFDKTDVWMMKEYGVQESWTKIASIHVEARDFMAWGLLGQSEMLLSRVQRKLKLYSLKAGTVKDGVVDGLPEDIVESYLRFQTSFVESLISPHSSETWSK